MSGIWRWLKLKPSPAIESRRKTTTSTLNIISDQCLWTRNGNRKISVEQLTKPRPSSVSPARGQPACGTYENEKPRRGKRGFPKRGGRGIGGMGIAASCIRRASIQKVQSGSTTIPAAVGKMNGVTPEDHHARNGNAYLGWRLRR
jgi:hypothetical protein